MPTNTDRAAEAAPKPHTDTGNPAEPSTPKVEIYFKDWCVFSQRALALLEAKGVDYEPIDVTDDLEREREMRIRAGRRSVPQIFIDDRHIGGYDDMAALDAAEALDPLLGSKRDTARPLAA